jgi:transcriptional regulator with GAF, ATPase, and Fis domain
VHCERKYAKQAQLGHGMNPRVIGVTGPLKGTNFVLPGRELSIGRESTNHLWVPDPALSRRHCVITGEGDQFVIRDLGSRNGTRVNGVPVEQHELRHQDYISLGDSMLVFLLRDDTVMAERNPVQLEDATRDTADQAGAISQLRSEDALYLHPQMVAALPQTERLARDLNVLLKIATGIGGIRDREGLQWQLLGMILEVVPAERGAILLLDSLGEVGASVGWDRVRGPGNPVQVSRTLLNRVVQERVGLRVSDISKQALLGGDASLDEFGVKSVLCVPLQVSEKVIGVIYLDTRSVADHFDEDHLQLITAVAGIASLALDAVQHLEWLREENRQLQTEVNLNHEMVGQSPRMRAVYELIRRVAATDSTVLIQGESGTGKELVARAIHASSSRADGPFVAINCAAITETLLESELFGHEKGAFTGATSQKKGKLELANGGSLFLDEIGEFAPALQAKLLRVLQEREFERVGGTRSLKVDIRLIAATNRALLQAVEAGEFRRDLYYRLNVVAVTLPPLRERVEDIPLLADHLVLKASRKCRVRPKPISPEARACLISYDWPGNVRELEHAIERAMVMGAAESILPEDLPEEIFQANPATSASSPKYQSVIKEQKRQLIQKALQQANGNYIEAAKTLGLHPNSLLRLIRNLDLKGTSAEAQHRLGNR